jgi:glycosyltransferase involved in cell wall biosynthesis
MRRRAQRSAGAPVGTPRPATAESAPYAQAWRVLRDGPAPLLPVTAETAERTPLHVAVVLPSMRVGSGGHDTVLQVVAGLERRDHTCSLWVLGDARAARLEWPATLRRKALDHYAAVAAPAFRGFADWYGADVALATSWETAYAVAALPNCRARAYMLNDHEPEFHATSVERDLAQRTYGLGLHGIAGSPWLQELYTGYGGEATTFEYGIDHDVYRPRAAERAPDTVLFYGRHGTPRRAVPLGLAALERLHERRPGVRIVIFGDESPVDAPFPYEHVGVTAQEDLARLFSAGTVGLSLSLTNYSLVALQMAACGMPCVELDGPNTRGVFGDGDAVLRAPRDPDPLATALERLLDDPGERERRAAVGAELARGRTWEKAAAEVEAGLRGALRRRVGP